MLILSSKLVYRSIPPLSFGELTLVDIDSLLALDTNEPPREGIYRTLDRYAQDRSTRQQSRELVEESDKVTRAAELQKQQPRRWKVGDVYAPHDLSPAEMKKWKQRSPPDQDVFDILHINPIDEYKVSIQVDLVYSVDFS